MGTLERISRYSSLCLHRVYGVIRSSETFTRQAGFKKVKALIYGLGRSGRAAAQFVQKLGWDAAWCDALPQEADLECVNSLGLPRLELPLSESLQSLPEWTIAAPGVPIDHPDLEFLKARGSKIIGELELGFLTRRTPMIAVTGTAGKTGTVSLIAQLLRALEIDALECGNFDPPLLSVIDGVEVPVVEVSSFQLERVSEFHPLIGVITNLGVDHLNRHGTLERYHGAKLNLARRQTPEDVLIAPQTVLESASGQAQRYAFEPHPGRIVDLDGDLVSELEDLPSGLHPANVQAAVLSVIAYFRHLERPLGLSALRFALKGILPVEGRFQALGQVRGVTFLSDSIATRTLAVKSALERSSAPVAWIVGGRDKGANTDDLQEVVAEKVVHIFTIGTHGLMMATRFGKPITQISFDPNLENGHMDMLEACQQAFALLSSSRRGGSIVLAPLCESFDQFRDYKDRATAFYNAYAQIALEQGGET